MSQFVWGCLQSLSLSLDSVEKLTSQSIQRVQAEQFQNKSHHTSCWEEVLFTTLLFNLRKQGVFIFSLAQHSVAVVVDLTKQSDEHCKTMIQRSVSAVSTTSREAQSNGNLIPATYKPWNEKNILLFWYQKGCACVQKVSMFHFLHCIFSTTININTVFSERQCPTQYQ